jgi:uncharacterized protein YerC
VKNKLNKLGVLLSIGGVLALIITIALSGGGKEYIPSLLILLAGLTSFFIATLDLSILESIPIQDILNKKSATILTLIAVIIVGGISIMDARGTKVLNEYNYSTLREDIITPQEISKLISRFGIDPTHQYLKNQNQEKSIRALNNIDNIRNDIITPQEISNLINRFGVKPTHQYLKNQGQEKSITELETVLADN